MEHLAQLSAGRCAASRRSQLEKEIQFEIELRDLADKYGYVLKDCGGQALWPVYDERGNLQLGRRVIMFDRKP
jgi:hypothetical protein